ncbi:hypothetical protein LXL04_028361 [Taraxacum kok-saghyz]
MAHGSWLQVVLIAQENMRGRENGVTGAGVAAVYSHEKEGGAAALSPEVRDQKRSPEKRAGGLELDAGGDGVAVAGMKLWYSPAKRISILGCSVGTTGSRKEQRRGNGDLGLLFFISRLQPRG